MNSGFIDDLNIRSASSVIETGRRLLPISGSHSHHSEVIFSNVIVTFAEAKVGISTNELADGQFDIQKCQICHKGI
jgi:hypothetical protein